MKGYFAAMRQAFGDFSVTRGHVLVDGRWAAAQTRMAGVFEREFSASPVGPLPPTGRGFVLDLQNIFRYDDSCKLVDEWAQYDLRGMLAQLGAAGRVEPGRPRGCAKRCAPRAAPPALADGTAVPSRAPPAQHYDDAGAAPGHPRSWSRTVGGVTVR